MKNMAVVALLFLVCVPSWAQQTQTVPAAVADDVKALREMAKEDRTAIDSLVLYPEDLRNSIFEVSAHPELLGRMGRMHRTAAASFQRIVSCVTPAEQLMAYDIARYPGLAADLAGTDRSSVDFQKILIRYPTAIHSAAMALATRREPCDILANLYNLEAGVEGAYASLIADYPKETQAAANLLLACPEILELLLDNMDQAVLIGNIYKKDPAFVRKRAAELGKTVAEEQARAEAGWKTLLSGHPMAIGELTQAAAAFAAEKRKDPDSREKGTLSAPAYSFWFGAPSGAAWYSYPDYFLWGFYFDSDGSVILTSLPSAEFVEWLDTARYPRLADAMAKQYRAHPDLTGGFYASVKGRLNAMKEEPPAAPVSETARNLAEGLKLAAPTDIEKQYKATDYWMSTNYQAIKKAGEIGGTPRQ